MHQTSRANHLRGFTMVESLISMIIIGVTLVAAMNTVSSARKRDRWIGDVSRAAALASDLLAEVGAQPYADGSDSVTVSGPTATESATGNRSLFNDVNDYQNWSETTLRAKDGTALGYSAEWGRSVKVEFVNPGGGTTVVPTDQGMARVTVRVSKSGKTLATLSTLRSAGLPATVACRLSDGTWQNLVPAHCAALGGTSGGAGSNVWTTAEGAGSALVAHWKFNESTGTSAADSVNGNGATLLNGAGFQPGTFGNAMSADGGNDYASVPDATPLSITSEMTLSAWIYLEAIPGSTAYATVLHKGTATNSRNYFLQVYGTSLSYGFFEGGVTRRFSGGTISKTKKWYHVAATYSQALGCVKLYLDGAKATTSVTTSTPEANTQALTIGSSPYGDYLSGRIDDVRIYSRVLSDSEITTLFNGGEP